jgi:ABC-type sugar transport system ATPase subunit
MGSGRSELARILFGLDPFETGSIRINGRALSGHNAAKSIRNGMAFVTENRREEGLMMESAISDNIALVSVNSFARTPLRIVDRTTADRSNVRRGGGAEDQGRRHPQASSQEPVRRQPAEGGDR